MPSTSPRQAEPIGTIGNYDVLRKIADGGMGEVFLARQRGPSAFSRLAVLKRLHPQFLRDPYFVQMFLNEAQIAANLSHPNIIHIYELFEERGGAFVIAMEYVRGGTVLGLMRERARAGFGGLPFGAAARIASGVCEALHYAYFEPGSDGSPRGVIHRDVSPSNVMVGYDGQVKLLDFGIAKVSESETQSTTLKGKFGYLSPEQVQSLPLDHRTDVFSLGTMLWEMLTGRRLFKRDNDLQIMYAILNEPIPPPSSVAPAIPAEVDELVLRALARDRAERFQDARELEQELRQQAERHGWDTKATALSALCRASISDEVATWLGAGTGSDSKNRPAVSHEEVATQLLGKLAEEGSAAAPSTAGDSAAREHAHHDAATELLAPTPVPAAPAAPAVDKPPSAQPAARRGDEHGVTSDRALAALILIVLALVSASFWLLVAPTL